MKKQRRLLIYATFILMILGTVFYFNEIAIPRVKAKTEGKYLNDGYWVLMTKQEMQQPIGQSTKLTKELMDKYFTANVVPSYMAAKGAIMTPVATVNGKKYSELEENEKAAERSKMLYQLKSRVLGDLGSDGEPVLAKFTQEELVANEQITGSSYTNENKRWEVNYDKEAVYEIQDDLGGQLSEGQYVDMILDLQNGDYVVVASKKRVRSIIKDKQKNEIKIKLTVNEREFRDLELANKIASFTVRAYQNDAQPKSKVTFNYDLAVQFARDTMDELLVSNDGREEAAVSEFIISKYNRKRFIEWFNDKEIDPVTGESLNSGNETSEGSELPENLQ